MSIYRRRLVHRDCPSGWQQQLQRCARCSQSLLKMTRSWTLLTVTADDDPRVFGNPNPVFTATVSGFKYSETLATSGVSGTASCSTTATASSVQGIYPITCTIGTLAASNYSFTFAPGTLTITNKWTTNGFFQPVDMDKVNTVKAGGAVPLKFNVLLDGVKVCDVSLVQSLRYREVVTVAGLQTDEIELPCNRWNRAALRRCAVHLQLVHQGVEGGQILRSDSHAAGRDENCRLIQDEVTARPSRKTGRDRPFDRSLPVAGKSSPRR